jgi:hypothetical protein
MQRRDGVPRNRLPGRLLPLYVCPHTAIYMCPHAGVPWCGGALHAEDEILFFCALHWLPGRLLPAYLVA